jgi:membrane-associated protease RseP (regulator of RpoE activity)
MVLVEREALRPILEEIGIQYTGRVDDDTMARVGHFVGADTLLTYRLSTSPDTEMAVASFELRLLNVEHGTALFRQHTAAVVKHDRAGEPLASESTAFAARSAAAHGLAALMAAFGDDPLGVVPDYAWSGEGVRLLGVLEGSPASLAGLRTGDRVLSVVETPLRSWTDLMAATASLKVKRKMQVIQVRMPLTSLLNTSPE